MILFAAQQMKDNMIKKYDNNILSLDYQTNTGGYRLKLQEKDRWSYIEYYYIKSELVDALPLSEALTHKQNTLLETFFNSLGKFNSCFHELLLLGPQIAHRKLQVSPVQKSSRINSTVVLAQLLSSYHLFTP